MATVKSIIRSAYRKLGIVGGEGQQPTNYEYADALSILQSLIRGLITTGALGRMRDVSPVGSYTAGENERVYRTLNDPQQVISLPDFVTDQACGTADYGRDHFIYTYQRPVRDRAFVSIVDGISGNIADFIYDGQQKRWVAIYALTLDDYDDSDNAKAQLASILSMECPLSFGNPNGLSSYLAVSLSPEFGSQILAPVQLAARDYLIGLTHSYSTRDYGRAE